MAIDQKIRKQILKIPGAVFLYLSFRKLIRLPGFFYEFLKFKYYLDKNRRFSLKLLELHPSLLDKTRSTSFEPHYVYHPAWAARIIKLNNPEIHIDIASTLHFSTMLSAFLPVKFYDYRPALLHIDNLESEKADLTNLFFTTDTISSLSCMHTIEHIGLGRYGDPIDPEGDVKAAKELSRIIKPGGSLIIVTPVGQPRIEFNAHRIYSYQQVLSLFPDLILKEFSLIPDDYKTFGLIRNANPDLVKDQRWGCGCFEFTKE